MSFLDKVGSGGGSRIEGKVVDYSWENGFPLAKGGEWVDADDRENTDNLHLVVKIQPEGADEDETITKVMYAGSNRFLVIEEDGKLLRAGEDGEVNEDNVPTLFKEAEAYRFLGSLDEAGFSLEARLPDPEETKSIDLRPVLGTRLIIVNEKDAEATAKFGKRPLKKGAKGPKDGYDRTWLKVSKVLSLPDEKGASKKASAAVKGSSKKAAPIEEEDDEPTISNKVADKFIKAVIGSQGKDGVVPREKLTLAVTRTMNAQKLDLNENAGLRKFVTSEEYLADAVERDVIAYDPKAKKPGVSLSE